MLALKMLRSLSLPSARHPCPQVSAQGKGNKTVTLASTTQLVSLDFYDWIFDDETY